MKVYVLLETDCVGEHQSIKGVYLNEAQAIDERNRLNETQQNIKPKPVWARDLLYYTIEEWNAN